MTVLEESRHTAEFVVSEANGRRSRGTGTLAEGNTLEAGAVLGQLDADGNFTELDPGADPADGSETAVAILFDAVDAGEADEDGVVVMLRDCEVNGHHLVWPEGITEQQREDAIGELAEKGIIVR